MTSRSSAPHWEAPKFSFNAPIQADVWKSFYTRVLEFLEALDIDPNVEDQGKRGWRQIKMMFEDEDCLALQTLIDNKTITPAAQWTPSLALKAIQSVIKEDVHFWHHRDELLTDLQQLPNEGIHALSTCIATIIGKCSFPLQEIKDMLKFMVLQHTVKYHEVWDWIHLQDQSTLTYKSLLNYCTQLEARREQFKQVQAQGRAQLSSITVVSATPSSLLAQSGITNICCKRCGYTHPCAHCPTYNKECYNCHSKGHFTALCRKPKQSRQPNSNRSSSKGKSRRSRRSTTRSVSPGWYRSQSRGRQPYRSPSNHWDRSSSNSRSPSQDHHNRNSSQDHHNRRFPRCNRCSPTPYRYKVSHFSLFQDHSPTDEGQLYTDKAPDGHRAFHTTLQLVTRQGPKPLSVKVNPGADASIIPLSRYRSLFPHHFHTNGTLRSRSLRKTNATWSAHNGTTHNFIGFFTIDVQHKTKPDVIPISFYIFKDSTRPSTLFSYTAYVHLGIIEFKVPNEARSHSIDSIKSKKKKISFPHPYVTVNQLRAPQRSHRNWSQPWSKKP